MPRWDFSASAWLSARANNQVAKPACQQMDTSVCGRASRVPPPAPCRKVQEQARRSARARKLLLSGLLARRCRKLPYSLAWSTPGKREPSCRGSHTKIPPNSQARLARAQEAHGAASSPITPISGASRQCQQCQGFVWWRLAIASAKLCRGLLQSHSHALSRHAAKAFRGLPHLTTGRKHLTESHVRLMSESHGRSSSQLRATGGIGSAS